MATIRTEEDTKADVFIGSKEALVAAGIVRADQFPPLGKLSVSYYSGVARSTRGVIDENWLRIVAVSGGQIKSGEAQPGDWVVHKGVPQAVARTRYQAWLKRVHEEADDRERREAMEAREAATGSSLDRFLRAIGQTHAAARPVLPAGWRVIQGGRHA